MKMPSIILVMRNLDATDRHGCWTHRGQVSEDTTYPIITVEGKAVSAHRWMYEFVYGPIPDGRVIMHKCDNRKCANPEHLTCGTYAENNADMVSKGRSRYGAPRLTADQIPAIRADLRRQREIAADYGVSQAMISAIKCRRAWAKVQ